MADFRYFADLDGAAHQLTGVYFVGRSVSNPKPGDFRGRLPNGSEVPCTRYIEYKPNPSRHDCDSRCMNATGRTMKCECACGGRNHGKGAF
jgi:hypothetical protein